MAPSAFSPFLERLIFPQPALQRAGVRSIFAHLKKAPAHERPSSALGQEALTTCLTHQSTAVVDESAQQLVRLASDWPDLLDSGQAIELLLESLVKVSLGGIDPILAAIGAVVRTSYNAVEKHLPNKKERQVSHRGAALGERKGAHQSFQSSSDASPASFGGTAGGGELHPFQRAVLLRSECQDAVLRQVAVLLTQLVESRKCAEVLSDLQPFITFALLHEEHGGLLGRRLVRLLVHLAASSALKVAQPILELLSVHVTFLPNGGNQQAALAEDLTVLVQVLLEKAQQEVDSVKQQLLESLKARLLQGLLVSLFKAQRTGESLLPRLRTIGRLIRMLPGGLPYRCLPLLSWLLVSVQTDQEQLAILQLISTALDSFPSKKEGQAAEPLIAMVVLPITQLLALTSSLLRKGAFGALNKVACILSSHTEKEKESAPHPSGDTKHRNEVEEKGAGDFWLTSGEAKFVTSISSLVTELWQGISQREEAKSLLHLPQSVRRSEEPVEGTIAWLASLGARLQSLTPKKQGSKSAQESEASSSENVVCIAFFVAGALMMHPEREVRAESARILGLAARLDPVQAVPLLPAVLWWLQREETLDSAAKASAKGRPKASDNVHLALLSILPALGAHPVTVSPILKSLQPMLEPKTQLPLRAVGFRLLCDLWANLDRSFPRLQAVLMADVTLRKPSPKLSGDGIYLANREKRDPQLEWKVSRAACIREVCRKDAARGVELVMGIQAAIEDGNPLVSILGLQSLEALCLDDAIDFYTAWKVLRRTFSTVPRDCHVAATWASLLAHGAMDARAQPGPAAEVLSLLWEAAKLKGDGAGNDWWRVRKAAVESLCAYSFESTDEVLPRPLSDYVSLLLTETNADVRGACEKLVVGALQHEHSNRRRNAPETRVLPSTSSPALKLLQAVPNLLASSARDKNNRALSEASVFPGGTLYCYRPPPPTPPEEKASNRIAMKEYKEAVRRWADGYESLFNEASQILAGSSPTDHIQLIASLQTFARFMPTWLHALATALSVEKGLTKAESLGLAANESWVKLQTQIQEALPRVSQNGTLAAAALSSNVPGDLAGSVTSFLIKRLSEINGRDWAESSRALALGFSAAKCERETRGLAVETLLRVYENGDSSGSAKLAAGLALGLVGQTLGQRDKNNDVMMTSSSQRNDESTLMQRVLESFLSSLPEASVIQLAATWQLKVVPRQQSDEWSVAGAVAGLAQLCAGNRLPAVLTKPGSVIILLNLLDNLLETETREPILNAALLALPVVVPLAHRLEVVSATQAEQRLERLVLHSAQNLVARRLSAGALLDALLRDSCPLAKSTVERVLNSLDFPSAEMNQGVVYRVASVLGLANALGAGFGVLKSDVTKRQQGGRLMDDERHVTEARAAIQSLAKSVKADPDPKVQKLAAWTLGSLYNSRFGVLRGGTSAAENDPPRRSLQGLPEDGAMRPLLTSLLTWSDVTSSDAASSGQGLMKDCAANSQGLMKDSADRKVSRLENDVSLVAAALRCLQKAPRLPALNWGVLVRRLFRVNDQGGTSRDSRLRRECLGLAIAHGREVQALAAFLEDTCDLARLVTLEIELQAQVAQGLAGVLRALPQSGGLRVLGDLRDLVLGLEVAEKGKRLQVALWQGLTEVLTGFLKTENQKEDGASASDALQTAALETVKALYSRLPESFTGVPTTESPEGTSKSSQSESVWTVATKCLAKTDREWLMNLLELPSSSYHGQSRVEEALEVPKADAQSMLRAVVARVQLARISHLRLTDLKPCRKWLLEQLDRDNLSLDQSNGPDASQRDTNGLALRRRGTNGLDCADLEGAVQELVSVLATAGATETREWLTETLDWALLVGRPLQGLTFLALLCHAWLQSTALFLPRGPSHALANLPYTFPAVLDGSQTFTDAPALIQKLTALLTKGDARVRRILIPCLVGMREKLAKDTWQYVANLAVSESRLDSTLTSQI